MTWESDRPHGRAFTIWALKIEALPTDDAEIDRLADALDALDVEESLAAVARRIEEAIPEFRVEIT